MDSSTSTDTPEYTQRLVDYTELWWKKLLDVQRPYRWNVRRYDPGFVLDIGCGIGRNLANLAGNGIGVDHNEASVEVARRRGFRAFCPTEFHKSEYARPGRFDSILLSHVLEHMSVDNSIDLVAGYLQFLKKGGKVIVFTPQEAGQASDPSHLHFMDFATLATVGQALSLKLVTQRSFPFPRKIGKYFKYNEFNSIFKYD